jgi:predicted permease
VRLALGAGRARLVRQLLTETLALFLVGGAAGMLIAIWGARLIGRVRLPVAESVVFDATPDFVVFAFALAIAATAGFTFGLAPALQASRPNLVATLKDGAGAGQGRRSRSRGAFVVAQLSMAVLLLVIAGLFVRTLQNSLAVEPGFDAAGVHVATIDLRRLDYDAERGPAALAELTSRLASVPGIESASHADLVLLSGSSSTVTLSAAETPDERVSIGRSHVDGGYFATMRIPLVSGRGITAGDVDGAERVVVVNETLARRFWPDASPVGRFLRRGSDDYRVVGVARDGRYQLPSEPQAPFAFFSADQAYFGYATLHVRSRLGSAETIQRIRAEVHAVNPDLAIAGATSLETLVAVTLLPQRVAAWLIGGFGLVGLILAGLGVYGIVAYQVAQRTREFGIRMALGARSGDVLAAVVGQGARLAAIGAVIGLALAAAGTRLLAGLLYGVAPLDPLTFGAVALLLGAVALLASALPARRATRLDPLDALRHE